MSEVRCFAYAEDALSCAVMKRLVDYCNEAFRQTPLYFHPGFPENKRGCGNLKNLIPNLCSMAFSGVKSFVLTDLDAIPCAPELIRTWFRAQVPSGSIPQNVLFRVAEREVETWLLADRPGLSKFLNIAPNNFSSSPDGLSDPKGHLLNVIQAKGRKKYHKAMLPSGSAYVGPEYNPRLCEFTKNVWNVELAMTMSVSLQRAVLAISSF